MKKNIAVAALFLALSTAWAQTDWTVMKTWPIGGAGSWDYLTVDPQTHLLYVPRTTHTLVIDPSNGKVLADLPGQKNAHGVAIAPASHRGFITDGGGEGAVIVFDLKTNAILGSIPAQPDADGIIYDPVSKRIVLVSGDKGTLMTLNPDADPKTGKIEMSMDLGGAPEFLASDRAGKIYVNLMDKNEVASTQKKSSRDGPKLPAALP
jgi:DNA-binding beta-propeller fold protein YncE